MAGYSQVPTNGERGREVSRHSPARSFRQSLTKDGMLSNLKALAAWFAYVQRTFLQWTGPPLRRQTLEGMRDEAFALNSLLMRIVGGQQTVTSDEDEKTIAIYKDIQAQIKK